MKSYYHAHESAYKEIKAKGGIGWGGVKTLEQLGDDETNNYLKSTIEKWVGKSEGKSALDLGCGSGTTAFVLSKLGFNVTGVDISETAIGMAKDLALEQSLEIKFEIGDVLQLEKMQQKFDLIYDSHCFHCIVFDDDRDRVLEGVKNSLSSTGIFILDTMAHSDEFDITGGAESLRFDGDYILWHKTTNTDIHGVVNIEGQNWCAQRRLYPPEKIIQEAKKAGFKILSDKL